MIRRMVQWGVEGLPMGDFAEAFGPVVNALTSEVLGGGALGMADLPDGVKGSYRFDVKDPRAIAWAQTRGGALIRDLSDEARQQARSVIAQAVENGWTTGETATELRRTIGLHDRWANAVSNAWPREYERLLGLGLSEAEAERRATAFTDRYRQRLIRARAENIARTEIITASNQGRWLSWAQGVEGNYISRTATKKWITGPLVVDKGRKQVCAICQGLRDEEVPWDKPFSNGQMMPPAHPSCRCTAVLVPTSIEEVEQRLRDGAAGPSKKATPSGIDWDEPVPQFKTTAEAEAWMQSKWGVKQNGGLREFKYGRTDPTLAQKFTEELDRMFKQYPQVAERIDQVGSAQACGVRIGPNTGGHASRYKRFLHWNEDHYRDAASARVDRLRAKASRWLASDDAASTIHHEFGHHVHYLIENVLVSERNGWAFRLDYIADDMDALKKGVSKVLRQTLGLKGNFGLSNPQIKDLLTQEVSRYATTNWKELIAESFAESMTDNPRRVATDIRSWIDEIIGDIPETG